MPSHLLYLDDSGTKRYAANPASYGRVGNTRYFVFGGLLIPQGNIEGLREELRTAKRACFGTDTVEIKSNWLRMPEERRRHYADPFGVTDEDIEAFVEAYYKAIEAGDLVLLASVVDKIHMQEDYGPKPWYPPAVAYETILQRVEAELRDAGGTVSVVIDDMSGATPKANPYKSNLKRQHQLLKQHGSRLLSGFKFTTLEGRLKFLPSERSELIQVADVVAYNVYRQFVEHGDEWEQRLGGPLPTYPWFRRLLRKFRSHPSGRIQGFGVVKFPLRERVQWGLFDRGGKA